MNINAFKIDCKTFKHIALNITYRDLRVLSVPFTFFDNQRLYNLAEYRDILSVSTIILSLFVGISVLSQPYKQVIHTLFCTKVCIYTK